MRESPLLYDVYCGGGGATKGYQRAGFRVVGIDNRPQPRYCGDGFILMDALEFLQRLIDGEYPEPAGIHTSPPCQGYANVTKWTGNQADHPRLIAPTRELLKATGKPWIIENVRTNELDTWLMLCGTMFGLNVIRHRYFEAPWMPPVLLPPCHHNGQLPFEHKGERAYADAMGCTWMDKTTARQAIPPAFTEFTGKRLMEVLTCETH